MFTTFLCGKSTPTRSSFDPEITLSHNFIFISLSSTFCAEYLGSSGYSIPSQTLTPHHDMTLDALSCRWNGKDMMVVQRTSYSPFFVIGWPTVSLPLRSTARAMFFVGSWKSGCAELGVAFHNCYSAHKVASQSIHDLYMPSFFQSRLLPSLFLKTLPGLGLDKWRESKPVYRTLPAKLWS